MADQRLDRFVAMVADISRTDANTLIKSGLVSVDGVAVTKTSRRLQVDELVETVVPERDDRIEASEKNIVPVVYVDDDVIVVDKPAGLVVHPGAGLRGGTVIQSLLAEYPDLEGVGDDFLRPGVVHRLDKGTSGLLMVARTRAAFEGLTEQLADRTVHRRYVTLVWGDLDSSEGVIDAPLGRSPREATKQAVVVGGKMARTHYAVEKRFAEPVAVNLLSCRLETGRTHQIRVHLEAIDHPVVGDDRYGPRREPLFGLDRPFLHAATLGFEHPVTGDLLSFESPLPHDLDQVLGKLAAAEAAASAGSERGAPPASMDDR